MHRGHAIRGHHAQMVLGRDRVSDRETEPTWPLGLIQRSLPGLYPGAIADKHWTVTSYERLHEMRGPPSGLGYLTTISGTYTAVSPESPSRKRERCEPDTRF